MSQDAASFFDRYAHDFDAIYDGRSRWPLRWIDRRLRRSMFMRYRRTLERCVPIEGRSVLDVGCGPGHYSVALAERGAERVTGLDVAPAMIELARRRAAAANQLDRCHFDCVDFMKFESDTPFDYVIVMGFMDYVENARAVVRRALDLSGQTALFSFPVRHGFLAWQRRMRYRAKTPLYMYDRAAIRDLFEVGTDFSVGVERLARDYFVTAVRKPSRP